MIEDPPPPRSLRPRSLLWPAVAFVVLMTMPAWVGLAVAAADGDRDGSPCATSGTYAHATPRSLSERPEPCRSEAITAARPCSSLSRHWPLMG